MTSAAERLIDVHHHWMPAEHYHGAERWLRPGEQARRSDGGLALYRGEMCVLPRLTALI